MPRFIGEDSSYGLFEKVDLIPDGVSNTFSLPFPASDANSILVVYMNAVQQPNVDYSLSGSREIVFDFIPAGPPLPGEKPLYILFLGRQLSVPATLGNKPHYETYVGDGSVGPYPVSVTPPIFEDALIVFKNTTLQRINVDYTLDNTTNEITFVSPVLATDNLDIHVFGLERNDLLTVDDGSITTAKLADGAVTAEKMNLVPTPYSPSLVTFGGMNISVEDIHEAEFIPQGVETSLRLHFTVTLTGSEDNKIRVDLPINLASSTVNLAGDVTLVSNTSMENGIIRWGSVSAIDIYRQHGVNYTTEEWTVELKLDYKSVA